MVRPQQFIKHKPFAPSVFFVQCGKIDDTSEEENETKKYLANGIYKLHLENPIQLKIILNLEFIPPSDSTTKNVVNVMHIKMLELKTEENFTQNPILSEEHVQEELEKKKIEVEVDKNIFEIVPLEYDSTIKHVYGIETRRIGITFQFLFEKAEHTCDIRGNVNFEKNEIIGICKYDDIQGTFNMQRIECESNPKPLPLEDELQISQTVIVVQKQNKNETKFEKEKNITFNLTVNNLCQICFDNTWIAFYSLVYIYFPAQIVLKV